MARAYLSFERLETRNLPSVDLLFTGQALGDPGDVFVDTAEVRVQPGDVRQEVRTILHENSSAQALSTPMRPPFLERVDRCLSMEDTLWSRIGATREEIRHCVDKVFEDWKEEHERSHEAAHVIHWSGEKNVEAQLEAREAEGEFAEIQNEHRERDLERRKESLEEAEGREEADEGPEKKEHEAEHARHRHEEHDHADDEAEMEKWIEKQATVLRRDLKKEAEQVAVDISFVQEPTLELLRRELKKLQLLDEQIDERVDAYRDHLRSHEELYRDAKKKEHPDGEHENGQLPRPDTNTDMRVIPMPQSKAPTNAPDATLIAAGFATAAFAGAADWTVVRAQPATKRPAPTPKREPVKKQGLLARAAGGVKNLWKKLW